MSKTVAREQSGGGQRGRVVLDGLIGALIGAVVVRVRYLPQAITHQPGEVALGLLGCVAVAVAAVRLSRERRHERRSTEPGTAG